MKTILGYGGLVAAILILALLAAPAMAQRQYTRAPGAGPGGAYGRPPQGSSGPTPGMSTHPYGRPPNGPVYNGGGHPGGHDGGGHPGPGPGGGFSYRPPEHHGHDHNGWVPLLGGFLLGELLSGGGSCQPYYGPPSGYGGGAYYGNGGTGDVYSEEYWRRMRQLQDDARARAEDAARAAARARAEQDFYGN